MWYITVWEASWLEQGQSSETDRTAPAMKDEDLACLGRDHGRGAAGLTEAWPSCCGPVTASARFSQGLCQGQLCLISPVQAEMWAPCANCLRIPRWQRQSVKPRVGPIGQGFQV